MFEDEEWLAIIRRLIDLSQSQDVTWVLCDDGLLQASIGPTTYTVGPVADQPDGRYYLTVSKGVTWDLRELARIISGPSQRRHAYSPAEAVSDLQKVAFRMSQGGPQLAAKLLADMETVRPSTPAPLRLLGELAS